MLQEYVSGLGKAGELPKPDEVKWGNYPRYRYAYTDSKIGTAYFEIINYAGGVIHHSRFRNEDSTELLKHFIDHNVDGIIVLVSAPKEGQEQSDIPDEIATIQAAVFSFIKGEGSARHRYPVALALTKWDRQWERGVPIPPNDADVEAERLARFMEQHTAYQEVCDLLKRSADGNFKTFPVSALGLCSNDDKPCKIPLESYGLPFVFRWLIQSANDADFRRFEKLQSELPWWRFRPHFPFQKSGQPDQEIGTLADKLLERLPETEEKKRAVIKSAKERFIRTWRMQMTGFVATLLLLFAVGIGGIIRTFDMRMPNTVISNPASIQEDLKDGEVDLTLTATLQVGNRIFWGGGSANTFTLSVDGMPKITIEDLNPLGFNSNQTLVLANNLFQIKGKLTDRITVRAGMRYNNWRKRDQGGGSKTFTIGELRQGQSLTLASKDDPTVRHTLILKAEGFPPEPSLPERKPSSDGSNE